MKKKEESYNKLDKLIKSDNVRREQFRQEKCTIVKLYPILHPKEKKKILGNLCSLGTKDAKRGDGKGKTTKKEEPPERERKRERGRRHHSGGSSYITLIVAIITIL